MNLDDATAALGQLRSLKHASAIQLAAVATGTAAAVARRRSVIAEGPLRHHFYSSVF